MKVYLIDLSGKFMVNDRIHPPLGLMYLNEWAGKNGIDCQIVDDSEVPMDGDFYGISATTPQYPEAVSCMRFIHSNTMAKVIIGGVHASAFPEDCAYDGFDFIVSGEGERAFLQILGKNVEIKSMDDLPHPKIESLNGRYSMKMTYVFDGKIEERSAGWIMTARGCPGNCYFCASNLMWEGRLRIHSVDYVQDWLNYYLERGINDFHIADENFTVGKNRLFKLCKILSGRGYWRCNSRGDTMTEEKAKVMYESGCRQVTLGVETGSQKLIDSLNKKEAVADNENAIKILKDSGIGVKASFMVGLPNEADSDVMETAEFIERTRPDEVTVAIFVPYPGCHFYGKSERDWKDYISVGKEKFTPVFYGNREDVYRRKKELLEIAGDSYILDMHKERWDSWNLQ